MGPLFGPQCNNQDLNRWGDAHSVHLTIVVRSNVIPGAHRLCVGANVVGANVLEICRNTLRKIVSKKIRGWGVGGGGRGGSAHDNDVGNGQT